MLRGVWQKYPTRDSKERNWEVFNRLPPASTNFSARGGFTFSILPLPYKEAILGSDSVRRTDGSPVIPKSGWVPFGEESVGRVVFTARMCNREKKGVVTNDLYLLCYFFPRTESSLPLRWCSTSQLVVTPIRIMKSVSRLKILLVN